MSYVMFSGVRLAHPVSRRDTQPHVKNFRQFTGLRATDSPPACLIKMDAAGELEGAAHEVGLVPETSLPNRWPHNTVLERDIREEKECCRSIHLQSGLPYSLHTFSYPFACLSMSFDRPAPFSPGKTQWEALTKEKFQGKRCCFGQMVWYRTKTPGKRTLDPNMAPALFLGWRVDPGLRYRNVVKVVDYEAFRKDGSISVHDVPEPELFVEDGPPSFPIAAAADRALHGGKTEGSDPPTFAPARGALWGHPLSSQSPYAQLLRESSSSRKRQVVAHAPVIPRFTVPNARRGSPNLFLQIELKQLQKALPKLNLRSPFPLFILKGMRS